MSEQRTAPTLNERSRTILDFIRGFVRRHRVAPSIREIMAGCDLTTTSVVEYYLQRLEREGYLRRSMRTGTYRAPRGIVLLDSQAPSAALPVRRGARAAKLVASLESIFPVGTDPECDICGQAAKTEDDRFCAGCRRWLERFARTTSPAHAGEDLARCLAAMLRSGERPAEWSASEASRD
jgi:LexA DNA binding domain-containing protein